MKKTFLLLIFSIFIPFLIFGDEAYFFQYPTLTPDGKSVIFSYNTDLWAVPSTGGTAYRLTGMEGEEIFPRVSPDGKWLAFSCSQNGDFDIYIMPINGGEIKQLTFNDAQDYADSWSWDSKQIYFASTMYNEFSEYKISKDGGTPERLFENYFNRLHGLVENPVTKEYYFTDSWESFRFVSRKGYKGDYNPDINSYNPQTKEHKLLTTYRGKDFQPTIDKYGNLYFISDEGNGEFNLFTLKDGIKQQLTSFDSSIRNPQVNADGGKVIFEKDYQLYLYDVNSKKTEKLVINLPQANTLEINQDFNVENNITFFEASPDGKKLAFASRGELFVSDIDGKFVKQLPVSPEGRVVELKWIKDSRTLLFNQTVDGWLNLFIIQADGKSQPKQITFDKANDRCISINNKKDKAAYISGRNDLRLLNLADYKSSTILSDELWATDENALPRFSPDDNYIAFTAYRNFEEDIFIYTLKTDKTINLTDTGVTETQPFWSPDGKYMYFTADRLLPSYPRGEGLTKIYRLPLEKIDTDFKSNEFEKLFVEEKPDKKKEEKVETPVVTIDLKDVMYRLEQISPNAGEQYSPYIIQKEKETVVFFLSDHDGDKDNLWKTVLKPFDPPETVKINGAEMSNLIISSSKDKSYVLVKGVIQELDLKENKLKPVKINYVFRKNLRKEFNQMFSETWANLQENFYDENFHGKNWDNIKSRYGRFLPYVQTRSDLRRLIDDMLGELNSSHLGFYSSGDEEKTFHKMQSIQTGIIFENDNPYRVKYIVKNSPADKKGIEIKAGDELVAVNGVVVDSKINRESYLTAPSIDQEVSLTFKRLNETYTIKIHPQATSNLKLQLYDEWAEANQKYVDEKSNNRIAYIHMKNMGGQELNNFIQEMTSEWYKKDALILDIRNNTGGNVHDAVLSYLSRRPYLQWKYRGGKLSPQPSFAPSGKPIVLLVNEQSLSDAEMTAAGFKALKLGKIIGTETYRWIIFTTGKTLVDGSFCRLPSWGCFTLDGNDIELNGVQPDIYVKTIFKDRLEGKDPQLDKAIEEIMKDLK